MSRILTPDQVRRSRWQIPPGRTDLGTVRTLDACVVRTRTHAYVHVHLTCNFLQEPASWLSTVLVALCRELARWPVGRRHPHTRKSRREPVVALPYRAAAGLSPALLVDTTACLLTELTSAGSLACPVAARVPGSRLPCSVAMVAMADRARPLGCVA